MKTSADFQEDFEFLKLEVWERIKNLVGVLPKSTYNLKKETWIWVPNEVGTGFIPVEVDHLTARGFGNQRLGEFLKFQNEATIEQLIQALKIIEEEL